jgi:hypothetical protein
MTNDVPCRHTAVIGLVCCVLMLGVLCATVGMNHNLSLSSLPNPPRMHRHACVATVVLKAMLACVMRLCIHRCLSSMLSPRALKAMRVSINVQSKCVSGLWWACTVLDAENLMAAHCIVSEAAAAALEGQHRNTYGWVTGVHLARVHANTRLRYCTRCSCRRSC